MPESPRELEADIKVAEDWATGIRENYEVMIQCRNTGRRWAELQHRDALVRCMDGLDHHLAQMRVAR